MVQPDTTTAQHGTRVFLGANQLCHCQPCDSKREAVHELVESFSSLPSEWFRTVTDNLVPLPMWGCLWLVSGLDSRSIERLTRPLDDDDDMAGFDWLAVSRTGIYAITYDDRLVLGINGAGYSFFDEHWEPLYDALGYRWHERGNP